MSRAQPTSKGDPARRASLAACLALLLLPAAATAKSVKLAPAVADPAGGAKAPVDIDALLAGLAKAPGLYAHFREEKHLTDRLTRIVAWFEKYLPLQ